MAELGRDIRDDAGSAAQSSSSASSRGLLLPRRPHARHPRRVGYGFIDVVRDIADTADRRRHRDRLPQLHRHRRQERLPAQGRRLHRRHRDYLLTQLRQKDPAGSSLVALLDRPDLRTVELSADYPPSASTTARLSDTDSSTRTVSGTYRSSDLDGAARSPSRYLT